MLIWLSSVDTQSVRLCVDQVVDLVNEVALEASDDVSFALSFGGAPVDIGDCGLLESHADDNGSADGRVQLAVSTVIDSVLASGHP